MSIGVVIFTYNRIDMLKKTLASLYYNVDDILVLDDASIYKLKGYNVIQNEYNGGKHYFYEQWQKAFDWVKATNYDNYIFMPDDFVGLGVKGLTEMYSVTGGVLNLINDGRDNCWGASKVIDFGNYKQIGFTDCGFITSRENISKLNYHIEDINRDWFAIAKSSGVGAQLTNRFKKAGVKFYKPLKSFCYHGEHESVMHKEERLINPLLSI